MQRPDRATVIDMCWPPTRTPTEDDIVSAAVAVRELLYYLNHAMVSNMLRDVATIHSVTANVGSAIAHSGLILDQLAWSVPVVHGDDPRAQWDQHTVDEKYQRLDRLLARRPHWLLPAKKV